MPERILRRLVTPVLVVERRRAVQERIDRGAHPAVVVIDGLWCGFG